MKIEVCFSHWRKHVTVSLRREYGSGARINLILDELGKWQTVNPVRLTLGEVGLREAKQAIIEAEELKREIGTTRNPDEILRRMALFLEADGVKFLPPYDMRPAFESVSVGMDEYLDNPGMMADWVVGLKKVSDIADEANK